MFLRPDFNRSIMMDFQGAKLSSDTWFLLMRELDQRHNVIAPMAEALEDNRSAVHTKHSFEQMIRHKAVHGAGRVSSRLDILIKHSSRLTCKAFLYHRYFSASGRMVFTSSKSNFSP